MFLKSIELFGFKSFAEKTQIEFREGVTAVLGPNGCGKSNIVDSIKWVLGEQSTKDLRASRMEDIIFNGTESKKSLNVAEVTIILSNSDNLFPFEMAEISIKRRLFRSGESEYFINNTQVRLKDIKELFFDTGIGKSAYSLMEQGRIDQVLSNKPGERRYIFEEAAGISGYKARSAEAERKLAKTRENMKQVENILNEVKRSYNNLKIQSEKTVKYRDFQKKIFNLDKDLHLIKLKKFINESKEKKHKLDNIIKQRDENKQEIDRINHILETSIDRVNKMESNLIEKQKKLYGLDIEKNNKRSQIKILDQRIAELKRKIEFDKTREKAIQEKLARINNEKNENQRLLKELVNRIFTIEKNLKEFVDGIGHFNSRINENEKLIQENDATIIHNEQILEQSRVELREITDDIVTQLDEHLKSIGYSSQKRQEMEQNIYTILENLKIQIKGKNTILVDAQRIGDFNKKIMHIIQAVFSEALDGIEKLEELFGVYKSSTTFIDEFLSPQGIITKKRGIDEKINITLKQIAEARKKRSLLRDEIISFNKKIEEYRKTLEDLRVNLAKMQTQETAIKDEEKRLTGELLEQENLQKENAQEILVTSNMIQDITENTAKIKQEQQDLDQEENQLKQTTHSLEQEISQQNKSLMSAEKSLKEKITQLEQFQSKVEQSQMGLVEINTEIRNIYQNFRDKYSCELADYESELENMQLSKSELMKKINQVKEQVKELGQVNLMAPEEFIEVKERHDFLTTQMEDLKKACQDLEQVTLHIQTESTQLLLETFQNIKKSFNVIFRRLFGGGRAELKLSEPDKILESGIEIYAQPPGKKLESVDLLSGGEKSLTAISLLFAIYIVKPSPFCILDEMDAALDDENVGRFADMLKEFSQKTQFIIITHNKKTLVNAENLIGITMEESGISKIVTIRLQKKEDEKITV